MTKRQHEVLSFVVNYTKEYGYAPSVREIAEGVGVTSPATVHEHLEALRISGHLKRGEGMRAWAPTRLAMALARAIELPLAGFITAGAPIEAIQERETIAVPANFVVDGMNSYVLRVKGESMIEEGILDGDYVVIERNPSPRNGDVVVALLDNAFATLKKFYRDNGKVRLQPANPAMQPILIDADRVQIQGVVVGVMRKY